MCCQCSSSSPKREGNPSYCSLSCVSMVTRFFILSKIVYASFGQFCKIVLCSSVRNKRAKVASTCLLKSQENSRQLLKTEKLKKNAQCVVMPVTAMTNHTECCLADKPGGKYCNLEVINSFSCYVTLKIA